MGEHRRKGKTSLHTLRGSKIRTTFLLVVFVLAAVGAVKVYRQFEKKSFIKFDPDRSVGELQAPVQILEFLDFQCPQCAVGYQLVKKYMDEHPGSIHFSVRYYPLGELNSTISAVYAQCAAKQGKFFDYAERLLLKQSEWRTLLKVKPSLTAIAQDAGLDIEKLEQCVSHPEIEAIVKKDKKIAESRFIHSTPSYFVNGQLHVGVVALRKALDSYFAEKN